jgi:acyl-coenzyme A synthetase/AMP-(fatty) acid ligase
VSFEVILAAAHNKPDETALNYNGYTITYAAFASAIYGSMRALQKYNLPANHTAVVQISNLADSWVVVLALQALGLTTVCLHSADVMETLALQDIACLLTIEREAAEHGLSSIAGGSPVVVTSNPDYSVHALPDQSLLEALPQTGGHIQYTSGTTGTSKKLFFPAQSQAARIAERIQYRDGQSEIVCHCLYFGQWTAIGYRSPLSTWQMGGCVVFEQRPDWYRYFLHSGITEALLVPSMVRRLLTYVTQSQPEPPDLRWLSRTGLREVEVVDNTGKPSPVGTEGQLRIKLTELDSHSYVNEEAATRDVFRDGYFYPGDMAVQREDDRIRILGRKTDVITSQGRKRHVGPIEQSIQGALHIDAVCIFSGLNDAEKEEIVVVLETEHWPEPERLDKVRDSLKQEFEQVKFVRMFPFPRSETGMGKVDRIAMRDLVFAQENTSH